MREIISGRDLAERGLQRADLGPPDVAEQQHVRDHIHDFVAIKPRRLANQLRARPGEDLWFQPFYVEPRTGLLCSTATNKARSFLKKNNSKSNNWNCKIKVRVAFGLFRIDQTGYKSIKYLEQNNILEQSTNICHHFDVPCL